VGLLIGANPVFLQYSVSPVSGVAAGLFLALALNELVERADRKAAFRGGLWLGAALLMAYQTLLPSLLIFALLALRDRWQHREHLLGSLLGFGVGVGAQVGIDRITWGEWGLSLINYVVENVGAVLVRVFVEVGLIDLASKIYHIMERSLEFKREVTNNAEAASGIGTTDLQSPYYYLLELPQMIVWPAIGLAALGLARCFTRPSWKRALPVLVLLASAVVMSLKGAKSFRLWLPLLPMIAVLFALGLDGLMTAVAAQSRVLSRGLSAAFLLAAAALGVEVLGQANTSAYGSYWDAMAHVNERATIELESLEPGPRPAEGEPGAEYWGMRTVASAYHWAVFLRQDPGVALVKLPHHFSAWEEMEPLERETLLSSISHHHWLLLHEPLLKVAPEITERIARDFELETAFWDEGSHADMGAVLVLKRRQGSPKRPFAVVMDESFEPLRWRREAGLDRTLEEPIDFLQSASLSSVGSGRPCPSLVSVGSTATGPRTRASRPTTRSSPASRPGMASTRGRATPASYGAPSPSRSGSQASCTQRDTSSTSERSPSSLTLSRWAAPGDVETSCQPSSGSRWWTSSGTPQALLCSRTVLRWCSSGSPHADRERTSPST